MNTNNQNNRRVRTQGPLNLDAQYLRDAEDLLFTGSTVSVTFRNGIPPYNGPIDGLGEHCKKYNCDPQKAFVDGKRCGAFPTFKPSNATQRAALALAIGQPVEPDKVFTFATRDRANSFNKRLKDAGLEVDPTRHWAWGHTAPYDNAEEQPQQEEQAV